MGAPKVKTIGGGSAKPVADSFNTFLLNQLQSGGFQGMMSGQNNPSPLSFNTQVDMSNPQFAAMQGMLDQQRMKDMAALQQNFTGPGGRGTPAAYAQAQYMAQANPANIMAMAGVADNIRGQNRADLQAQGQYDLSRMGLDQNVMQMMMGALGQAQSLGTPQAQMAIQPSTFNQVMGGIAGLAPFALAPFTGGASLGIPGTMPNWNPIQKMMGLFNRPPAAPAMPAMQAGSTVMPKLPPASQLGAIFPGSR